MNEPEPDNGDDREEQAGAGGGDIFPEVMPLFTPGQLVRHQRYGYRGVIVDFDVRCLAPDSWYQRNLTQPDRNQPWYHVLVDGSAAVTYAAQSNLVPDHEQQPVHHPLVSRFFEAFDGRKYERNDTPWPGHD